MIRREQVKRAEIMRSWWPRCRAIITKYLWHSASEELGSQLLFRHFDPGRLRLMGPRVRVESEIWEFLQTSESTYPSREANIIDESEDIGRAQVQHGQQGLKKGKKNHNFIFFTSRNQFLRQRASAVLISDGLNSIIATRVRNDESNPSVEWFLLFADVNGNHVNQHEGNRVSLIDLYAGEDRWGYRI